MRDRGEPVRLSGSFMVTNVQQPPGMLQRRLTRSESPSQGLVTLRFKDVGGRLTLYDVRIQNAHIIKC